MTLNEFFDKMEWEGGFEEMASWAGASLKVSDSQVFNDVWSTFVLALEDLRDLYDDYEMNRPPEDEEENNG